MKNLLILRTNYKFKATKWDIHQDGGNFESIFFKPFRSLSENFKIRISNELNVIFQDLRDHLDWFIIAENSGNDLTKDKYSNDKCSKRYIY